MEQKSDDNFTDTAIVSRALLLLRVQVLARSQSTTPRFGEEADKSSVIHFKDAILPASDDENDLQALESKFGKVRTSVKAPSSKHVCI